MEEMFKQIPYVQEQANTLQQIIKQYESDASKIINEVTAIVTNRTSANTTVAIEVQTTSHTVYSNTMDEFKALV
jgi:uncharacterized protein YaaQ